MGEWESFRRNNKENNELGEQEKIMLTFRKIAMQDQPLIDAYFQRGQYENSECTFTNMFIWKDCYDVQWTEVDGYLVIQPGMSGEHWILPPYGDYSDGKLPRVMEQVKEYFDTMGLPFVVRGITKPILEVLREQCPNMLDYTEEREIEDYFYDAEVLRTLKGRKYHSKRNHISNFLKNHLDYVYEPLTIDNLPEAWEYLLEWGEQKKEQGQYSSDLDCERAAIREAFQYYDRLHIKGGVIRIDGKIQAFTMGEKINDETVVIHVEKANGDIQGLYAIINKEFLCREWPDVKYVNREEDTGDDSLRKAKMSYYPIKLVEKYKGVIHV